MSWNTVLQEYARLSSPDKQLPEGVFLRGDSKTIAIFDGYEKAKYHFLVMPRDPFALSSGKGSVPPSHLNSLSALLKSTHNQEVLLALKDSAETVKTMIEDEMLKTEGFSWPVQVGFHASESMKHVHVHVISSDLISEKLKNKKHYNSFNPNLGFFLHLDGVLEQVEANNITINQKTPSQYEALLKEPLRSIYTGEEFKTIPKLKEHLEAQWEKERESAKKTRAKATSLKRKGEDLVDEHWQNHQKEAKSSIDKE